MTEIYFDNAATTRPYDSVVEIVTKTMTQDYGNPSSMHRKGVEAERYLKDTEAILADILKVRKDAIFFTSGGTESSNWAIRGAAYAKMRSGRHLVTTAIEHPAVSETFRSLSPDFETEFLPVGPDGIPDLAVLSDSLRDDTILVSVMAVNNEIGSVLPLKEIGEVIRKKAPNALFYVDATQAFGHFRIYPKELSIDLLSASAHKFHGPKGVGFLYADPDIRILPLIYGGGQQKGMRSGTDNVPGIAGMGEAARRSYEDLEKKNAHLKDLKDHLRKRLNALSGVVIHTPADEVSSPHILSISFLGVGSEVLIHALEEKGIYLSSGSACSTHKKTKNPTLEAIGIPEAERSSAVRFSFDENNTKEEIDRCAEELEGLLALLRKYKAH